MQLLDNFLFFLLLYHMRTKIIYWIVAMVILIAWATGVWAFWGTKSCDEWNETRCFKDIKDFKKQYDKKEIKAMKITEEISDTQKNIDKWEAIKLEQETKRWEIEKEMGEINNQTNIRRKKLQELGFSNS